jgi:hypothetical protein
VIQYKGGSFRSEGCGGCLLSSGFTDALCGPQQPHQQQHEHHKRVQCCGNDPKTNQPTKRNGVAWLSGRRSEGWTWARATKERAANTFVSWRHDHWLLKEFTPGRMAAREGSFVAGGCLGRAVRSAAWPWNLKCAASAMSAMHSGQTATTWRFTILPMVCDAPALRLWPGHSGQRGLPSRRTSRS